MGTPSPFIAVISARALILFVILLDSILLAAWLGILSGFDWIVSRISNDGSLEWSASKWIFGASTLIVVLSAIYWDIRIVWVTFRRDYRAIVAAGGGSLGGQAPGGGSADQQDDADMPEGGGDAR